MNCTTEILISLVNLRLRKGLASQEANIKLLAMYSIFLYSYLSEEMRKMFRGNMFTQHC